MKRINRERWASLSSLLDELLELDPARRAKRLAQFAADDPALAAEVEALLAQSAEIERKSFLDTPVIDLMRQATAGDVVGSYTLERRIGEGGMGVVWLAQRSDGRFEGHVAIKFLEAARFSASAVERFRREGSVLARLSHPNIARLLDAGVAGQGQPYLVLEYVEGEPIDRWCEARALDPRARVRLFLDVLAAVAHAHGKLILHRDLKPSNILVGRDGQVKLLDFGIAKLIVDDQQLADGTLTQVGGRAFTPDFAAPEQVQAGEVTTATDVYALGLLLYLLLTGTHAIQVATRSPVDKLRAIVESEPRPLSDALTNAPADAGGLPAARRPEFVRALRGDLEKIVAKTLKKAPAGRYRTVDAFADDLQRHLNHEPVSARGDSLGYRVGRFVRRHRLAVSAAALLALTLVAGVAGTTWQAIEAHRQRADALAQRDRAQTLLARNEAIFDFFELILTEGVSPEQVKVIRQVLDHGADLIDIASGRQPEREAEILRVLASYHITLDDAQKAAGLLERARSLVPENGDRSLSARLACAHASALFVLEQRAAAIELLERWGNDPAIDGNVAAECLQLRAIVAQSDADPKQVTHFVEQALARTRAASPPSEKLQAALIGDSGFALHLAGRNAEAEQRYEEALARMTAIGQRESKEARRLIADWGVVAYASGDYRRGVALLEELLHTIERLSGDTPPSAGLIANYAFGLEHLARFDEALRAYDRAHAAAQATGFLAAEAYALVGKANVWTLLNDYTQAQSAITRAAALMTGKVPEQHSSWVRLHLLQARIDGAQGNLRNARAICTRVIGLLQGRGTTTSALVTAYRLRAEFEARDGNNTAALADAEKAIEIATKLHGGAPKTWSDDLGLAQLGLGRVLQAAGQPERARAALQTAVEHLAGSLGDAHPETRAARALLEQKGE
jgi:serine/threonine-protein kinase